MGCDIVFKINGNLRGGLSEDGQLSNQIVIKDSSLLSDAGLQGMNESLKRLKEVSLANIVRELLQSDNVEIKTQLVSFIKNLQDTSSRAVSAADIKEKGVIGNYKYHTLKYKYPELKFPDLKTPFDPDILLVDKLSLSGVNTSDVIFGTDTNDNQVFVISDTEAGVRRLINYAKTRDLILNQFEGSAELEELMPELAKAGKKFDSQQELLLDFISRNSEYQDLLVGKGAYGLLKEIVADLNNSNRAGYSNPLDREFVSKLKKVKGTKSDYSIGKKDFVTLVKIHSPELIQDLSAEQLKNDEVLAQLFDKFYENFTEFTGKLRGITDKSIIVQRVPSDLENAYGFTYSTISNQTTLEKVFRGFNIYKYTDGTRTKFMFSQDALSPKTISRMYDSVEEIEGIINSNYDYKETFDSRFELDFRVIPAYERVNAIHTTRYHAPGSVVKILDIELDRNTTLDPEEQALFSGDSLLRDFYEVFKKQLTEDQFEDLQRVVDSIETAGIFTYLINERAGSVQSKRDLQEGTVFDDVIFEISNAKDNDAYKFFFIQDCVGSRENYFVKMIPIKTDVQMNTTYSRPEPIIGLINEVIDEFNRRFQVGAILLTQDEINQQFPDIPAGTKAFIRDGKIYINGSLATSEDVIHEYTHLFLGALKAQNYDMYTKLLDKVMSSKQDMVESTKSRLRRIYPNLANSDLNEEVFVKLFADFLSGKRVDNMFDDVKAEVDSEMRSIFNLATDEDFNSLYRGRVKSIFQTFSKDIGRVGNGLDFSKGTVFRQAANWISDQMEKGDITERC